MSKEAATTEAPETDEYETLFNEFVDNTGPDTKLDLESDEDTATAEESEEEEDVEDQPDGEDTEATDDSDDNPNQSTPEGWEKRYRDLQSYSDKRFNALATEKQELEARLQALEAAQSSDTKKDEPPVEEPKQAFNVEEYLKSLPEEDRELFEDNPSLLKVMTDLTQKMVPKTTIDEKTVAALVAKQLEERQAQEAEARQVAEVERQKEVVRQAIPNAEEIISDREFQIWRADNQTRVVAILEQAENDADGVINVIKYYQSLNAMNDSRLATKRSATKGTAGAPKGTSTRASAKPSDDDYDAAFEYYSRGKA